MSSLRTTTQNYPSRFFISEEVGCDPEKRKH